MDVCDDHLSQNPDDKEIGYSNVLQQAQVQEKLPKSGIMMIQDKCFVFKEGVSSPDRCPTGAEITQIQIIKYKCTNTNTQIQDWTSSPGGCPTGAARPQTGLSLSPASCAVHLLYHTIIVWHYHTILCPPNHTITLIMPTPYHTIPFLLSSIVFTAL